MISLSSPSAAVDTQVSNPLAFYSVQSWPIFIVYNRVDSAGIKPAAELSR